MSFYGSGFICFYFLFFFFNIAGKLGGMAKTENEKKNLPLRFFRKNDLKYVLIVLKTNISTY